MGGRSGNPRAPSQPVPPLPQVAGWEAQKKEQPMFGEEQHVRYGDPRHPLNPAGHPRAPPGHPNSQTSLGSAGTPCSGGHFGVLKSLPGSLGHPFSSTGTPEFLCPCTPVSHRHPRSRLGSPESHKHPMSPVGNPGILTGSHGHPTSLVESPRSPCRPGTPDPCRVSRGPNPFTFPSAPRGSGRCYRDGSALGWAIRGAPRALPPALPHSPAGSGRRRRDLTRGGLGGTRASNSRPSPAPAPLREGGNTRGPPHPAPAELQSGLEGSWVCGILGGCGGGCWGHPPNYGCSLHGGPRHSAPSSSLPPLGAFHFQPSQIRE